MSTADDIRTELTAIEDEHERPFAIPGGDTVSCPLDASIPAVIAALRAVVDKCEQMRAESPIGRPFADEFEMVIAEHLLG